jgi:hypothetical protein
MSAVDTIGSVCIKEEVKNTEYSCACKKCSKEKE